MDDRADVVVIGAGPGGYGAAFEAADLGLDVVLVDPEANPGGVCLYRGCIPSKALLHVAKVIEEARRSAEWGVRFGEPEIDVEALRAWKDEVVAKLTRGVGGLVKKRKIRYVQGMARFIDPYRVELRGPGDEAARTLRFDYAIVATGSKPVMLPGLPEEHRGVMTSKEALELKDIPTSLLIVGGGYIGLEMASVYAALGSRVTLVEALPRLLTGVDQDLVEPLFKRLEKSVEEILLETKVAEVVAREDGLEVRFETGDDKERRGVFSKILVAVGRRPNAGNCGLERTRVEVGPDGFIAVDEARRTTERHIFAIGDVVAEPMLAHKATHEGIVAARVIAGRRDAFTPRVIPAVVYTDPEIAWCGLREEQARTSGRDIRVGRFPWFASGRATTIGRRDGLTKIIVDEGTGRIVGIGLCGPDAGSLIGEAALAMEMGALPEDLARTIHAHPTLSETLMEAAQSLLGQATHYVSRQGESSTSTSRGAK